MRGALPIVAALSLVLSSGTSFAAGQTAVYNNIPDPTPANVPSVGFEATSTSEFGGQLGFASNERTNPNVTVLMSSWACQTGGWSTRDCVTTPGATFTHPVTLNVYAVGADNEPGALLATQTQTFTMPYRPSTDPTCADGTGWRAVDGTCYNGKAFPITFSLTGTTLPDKAIVSVAYDTAHYGAHPLNVTGPYDSLNVGTNPAPSVGTALPTVADAYLNSSAATSYCPTSDVGPVQTGTFRLDSGCWAGYLPAFKVTAGQAGPTVPTDKDQCKKDGWKAFGNMFKNQGQCVSYTNHN
jgi:hypothetical protein